MSRILLPMTLSWWVLNIREGVSYFYLLFFATLGRADSDVGIEVG